MAPSDTTPAQACELGEAMRQRLLAIAEHAEPAGAELALTLTPAQLAQLQKKYAQQNADYRSDCSGRACADEFPANADFHRADGFRRLCRSIPGERPGANEAHAAEGEALP